MRALISVYDKTGIAAFAAELDKLGIEIVSTGGTAKLLKEKGIKVNGVNNLTGFPEIMNGRVKTLHPLVHGGILAKRDSKDHMNVVKEHNIPLIDIVVINLYPFESTIADPKSTWSDIIEKIDIGGPTMIRSAAKNHQDVVVLINPNDYSEVIKQLKSKKEVSLELKEKLAFEAFNHTAYYDSVIASYMKDKFHGKGFMSDYLNIGSRKMTELRYGENSHQKASLYATGLDSGLINLKQIQGKELSFNNYLDVNAAYNISKQFVEPTAVVIKHTNPCGVASDINICKAFKRAFAADSVSAFGGIIGLNQICDKDTAEEIVKIFVEVVIAPGFTDDALAVFAVKKNLRILEKTNYFEQTNEFDIRKISGGLLVQDEDLGTVNAKEVSTVTKRKPNKVEMGSMLLGWKVIKYVKSNAILLVKDHVVVGVGAGQMSRIESLELAIKRAGDNVKGSVMISDAFFPFNDCVELAAKQGVTAVIQPGGSVRDADSIEMADKHKMAMVTTGLRHFRH